MSPLEEAYERGKREGAREARREAYDDVAAIIDTLKGAGGANDGGTIWRHEAFEAIRALAAEAEVKPASIPLGEGWDETRRKLIQEVRDSERLTGADLQTRITGEAQAPSKAEELLPLGHEFNPGLCIAIVETMGLASRFCNAPEAAHRKARL